MRIRQQIHSAFLLIILASIACTIRVGEEPAAAPPAQTEAQSAAVAPLTGQVITNVTALATPGLAEQAAAPPVEAIVEPPAAPAPLVEAAAPASLVTEVNYEGTVSITGINELQAKFYPASNQLPAQFAVDRFSVRFRSKNDVGKWVPIRAELFVPTVSVPTEFPLFVYGAGTTGIGNLCAPLDEETRGRNWGQYQSHLLSYAAQGFITVMPHWQGYDDQTRSHNYFIAELEASTLLDVTRSTYEIFNSNLLSNVVARPAQAIFYGGYSQGGHGAFAALDAASQYAPELPIKGIVGHATAPNVEALLRERPQLAPYIIYAYLNYYGTEVISPESVFQSNWLPTFYTDASTKCVDEAYQYYPENPQAMYRPEFNDLLYGDRLGESFPAFKEVLDSNYVGGSIDTGVPVVLFHGAADDIVTPQTHNNFVARLCNQGKNVSYKLYPEINHFQTRQASFVDSITWMRNILNGQTPESQCSTFFTSQFE